MQFWKIYTLSYVLDLIIGDPNYSFHPIRLIGRLILFLENLFYRLKNKLLGGFFLTFTTGAIVFCISLLATSFGNLVVIILLYTTIATKSLAQEGEKVYRILEKGDLEKAKNELSYLVTRDTKEMKEETIIMSIIETISENSVDGVIAPMFYAFLGSFVTINGLSLALPMVMLYKSINTMDSMVGYKTEKYEKFGYFSAKTDDLLNLIPARVSSFILIPLSSFILGYDWRNSLKIVIRDRKKHSSPNSGHPEAAFAGALGVQFGGTIKYFNEEYEKEKIGDKNKEYEISDIKKCCTLLYTVSFTSLSFFIGLGFLQGVIFNNGNPWW